MNLGLHERLKSFPNARTRRNKVTAAVHLNRALLEDVCGILTHLLGDDLVLFSVAVKAVNRWARLSDKASERFIPWQKPGEDGDKPKRYFWNGICDSPKWKLELSLLGSKCFSVLKDWKRLTSECLCKGCVLFTLERREKNSETRPLGKRENPIERSLCLEDRIDLVQGLPQANRESLHPTVVPIPRVPHFVAVLATFNLVRSAKKIKFCDAFHRTSQPTSLPPEDLRILCVTV
mmetsp:Transcript_29487/g.114056  ORF Transcript_29487/g.114056 Transcript_29487/m.114056 type:complete len:234 (-) Transcript_29487:197-898(-)